MSKPGADFVRFSVRRMGLVLLFAAACFTKLSAQDVTIVSNGGFETPYGPGLQISAGSAALPGWTVEGTGLPVSLVTTGPYGEVPYQGQQFLLFDDRDKYGFAEASDSISQTIPTSVGRPYALTYALLQPNQGVFEVSAAASDGTVLSTNDSAVPGSEANGWILYQLFFTATTTNTTLAFVDETIAATDASSASPMGLDDVTIAEVIAPPTITEAPSNETVAVGTVVTFSASATAYRPMTIQWYYEASAIQGATNTSLTVTADETNVGFYTATFTDVGGASSTSCLLKLNNSILINGGFEAPPAMSGTITASPPGWTILSGSIELFYDPPPSPSGFPAAYQGNQLIAFNAGGASFYGIIAQTFQTTLDQSYTLSFAVYGYDLGDNLDATVTSATGSELSQTNCGPTGSWVLYQMSFTATTTNTTVTFAVDPGRYTGGTLTLDAVTVAVSSPLLGISMGTNEVILSWPAASEGFHLETTASMDTNWVVFPATLITNSNTVTADVPLSPTSSFFRLTTH